MTDIGVSCAKKSSTRDTIASSCGAGMVYESGLCYKACTPGYAGVGPVCWGTCPANLPYQCGAGCAKDIDTCATTTNDQVLSVVSSVTDMVLMVATAGIGTAAKKGIEQGTKVGVNAAAKSLTKNISKQAVKDSLKATAKKYSKELAETTFDTWSEALGTYQTQAVIDGAAGADIPDFNWADLDPTGIASIVTAYAHPVCAPPPAGSVVPGDPPSSTIPALPPGPPPPTWRQVSGLASDIAVTDTGTAWAIGNETTADKGIWRMRPGDSTWTLKPGRAKRVGAGGSDTVVVVTDNGAVFKWAGTDWKLLPGWASDAAVDAVGNVFVIGKNGTVWEMKLGQTVWTALPGLDGLSIAGSPVRISAAGAEKVTIVTDQGRGAAWVAGASGWTDKAYGGADVATLADGSNYAVAGTQIQHSKFGYQGEPAGATTHLKAVAAGGHNGIWALADDGKIWKRQ